MFEEAFQEETGSHLYMGVAVDKMSETPATASAAGPSGWVQDNEYVYQDLLGYTPEEYAALEEEGHVGMDYRPDP